MSAVIIDDDAEFVNALGGVLLESGYAVSHASNVSEAEALLAKEQIDLAVVDLNLAAESGIELIRQMGMKKPFLAELVPVVADLMKVPYPELQETVERVQGVISAEEERLRHVLELLADEELHQVAGLDAARGLEVDLRTLDGRGHDVLRRPVVGTLDLLAQVRGERWQELCQLRRRRCVPRIRKRFRPRS